MKKFLLATIAALSFAGAANATVYSVDVAAHPFRAAGPGMQTRAFVLSPGGAQNFTNAAYDVNLTNIGDAFSRDVFGLVAFDTPIDADDIIPRPSSVTFTIGGISATILGQTFAVPSGPLPSSIGYAVADYFAPVIIRVGPALGIRISLADTVFGTNGAGQFIDNRPGIGFVNATFTLAAIPVPASLPLALTGLGLLGFVARRRKLKGTTALAA